ncbi:hypothetical protein [Catenovulum agarivorans]|uniref:hypothetical protein n=1 Tax=Catenovulum agarivorans TaxID=1172192 RepID=UPI00145D0EBB|nr:hypothetical protein [Catenovulum agarivorans]
MNINLTSYQTEFTLEQKNTVALTINNAKHSYDDDWQVQAYLSGINMDMGKIPLNVIHQQQGYLIEVVPVMCAEANMRWQIEINLVNVQRSEIVKQSVFATFTTHW